MRLSEWRATEQGEKVMTAKQAAAFEPALLGTGASRDPVAYVIWGEDWQTRYTILAATDAGLAVCTVRVNVPQEGPRAVAKLIRWNRVTLGDLSVEAHHDHHFVSTQLEGQLLQGVDEEADRITAWIAHVFARIDGRFPPDDAGAARAPRAPARRG